MFRWKCHCFLYVLLSAAVGKLLPISSRNCSCCNLRRFLLFLSTVEKLFPYLPGSAVPAGRMGAVRLLSRTSAPPACYRPAAGQAAAPARLHLEAARKSAGPRSIVWTFPYVEDTADPIAHQAQTSPRPFSLPAMSPLARGCH